MDDHIIAIVLGAPTALLFARIAAAAIARADRLQALGDPAARAWWLAGASATLIMSLAVCLAVAGLMALIDRED